MGNTYLPRNMKVFTIILAPGSPKAVTYVREARFMIENLNIMKVYSL
jgi:hypothetical protein